MIVTGRYTSAEVFTDDIEEAALQWVREQCVSVRCSEERSQSRNRQLARERLLLKLLRQQEEAAQSAKTDNWSRHDALIRGNAVKKFSGPL